MQATQPDYGLLSIFVAVANEQSFTKAARKLGIGKGTVSRAIAALEEQLSAELLHRTTHAVALSTAGSALYDRVAPHLAALEQAVQGLPERAEVPSGELRITAPPDFGLVILAEALSHFGRRYPEVTVSVRLTTDNVDLVADGFDLAIRAASRRLKNSALTARRLGETSLGFFAAPSYVARRGKPKAFGETGHDWIVHPGALTAIKELTPRFSCSDFMLVRRLAQDGAGIGMMPRMLGTPFVSDGLLEEIDCGESGAWRATLYLVYPTSRQVPRKVIAFRDFLLEWLKRSPLS
jgi:DNA-binding transcriptional LysR family regulator